MMSISTNPGILNNHSNIYDHSVIIDYNNFDIDDLFELLKKENKTKIEDNASEETNSLDSIQRTINSLPKIRSSFEQYTYDRHFGHKEYLSKAKTEITFTRENKIKEKKESITEKWFSIGKPEMTPEIKRDLLLVQQRSALDPKRFYKKEKWQIPKHFQIGTVIEPTTNTKLYPNKKIKGQTMLQSLMNDKDSKSYFKKKYDEIQKSKRSGKKAHYKKVQKLRRRF
ncbi:Fcf2p [Ascoidea rubescens DSM 1968]|uniref:Fcf2-domain-containing protein n=1 Tax=Ascoidea rubescens DSM 1968 TaxID=1344418 RepID=A0A1D2VKH8_9ASCO|nr:Fcf2-domain-containing protein [Ascoidea rubescens DSM 1968]ODV62114.1 Fcf2-domain-containing protein [Ascoidea rubescens DSM 1968]